MDSSKNKNKFIKEEADKEWGWGREEEMMREGMRGEERDERRRRVEVVDGLW